MTPLMPPKSFSALAYRLAAVSLAVLLGVQPSVLAQSTADPEADAKELGGEMKAAVAVGMLDGDQARKLYFEILGLLYGEEKGEEAGEKGRKDWSRDDPRQGGMTYERFLISDRGDFTTLLAPEFLPRDGSLLIEGLERDPGLVALIQSLLEDYEVGFEAEADAFREALALARNHHELGGIQETLALIRMTPFTRSEIERNVAETLQKTNRGGMDTGQVSEWAEGRIASLQNRVGTLQDLIADKISSLEAVGTAPDAREILAMMESLRSARIALRTALEENLQAVVSEDVAAVIQTNLDLVRLEHGRRDARFGGADIDLGRAVRDASGSEGPDEATARLLLDLNASIADLVDTRTAARVDRETKTAQALVDMLAGEGPEGSSGDRLVMAAAERELVAGRVVRDATIQGMMRLHESLAARDPEMADEFLRLARRDGFPEQMRQRWCEEAIDDALRLEDLKEETRAALLELQAYVELRLPELQARAIEDRMVLEPRLGRAMVEGLGDEYAKAKSMGDETWREPGYERFDRLDDEVGRRLLGILGAARVKELPPHRSLGTRLIVPGRKSPGNLKGSGSGSGKGSGNETGKGSKGGGRGRGKG